MLAVVHQRRDAFFDAHLWSSSSQQVHMIWNKRHLIDGKPALSPHSAPIPGQCLANPRAKDTSAAISYQDYMMVQLKTRMRGRQLNWLLGAIAIDGRKDPPSVAVVLCLELQVQANRFNAHSSN